MIGNDWKVKVHGLYLVSETFDIEADTSDDAIIKAKRAWFDHHGPGIRSTLIGAEIDDDSSQG